MNKIWIGLKRGLVRDPKHRLRMGECVWLFEYMLDVADWSTGIISDWTDEAAAYDMQMPIRTIREQRRKLDKLFYICSVQKQHSQDIIIYKWVNPRNYSGEVLNPVPVMDIQGDAGESPSPEFQGDAPMSPTELVQGDTQGDIQGSTQDVTPTLDSYNQIPSNKKRMDILKKIKSSALLANLSKVIDPMQHGVMTIKDDFRKLPAHIVIGWLAKTLHDGRKINNQIAYLTKMLNSGAEPDEFYVNNFRDFIPDSYLESVKLGYYECSECDRHFDKRELLDKHFLDCHPFVADVDPAESPDSSPSVDESILEIVPGSRLNSMQAWDQVLSQLKTQTSRLVYDDLLASTAPIRWDDYVMSIGVESADARDFLEDRYTQVTQKLLVGILNSDVHVKFVATS